MDTETLGSLGDFVGGLASRPDPLSKRLLVEVEALFRLHPAKPA